LPLSITTADAASELCRALASGAICSDRGIPQHHER